MRLIHFVLTILLMTSGVLYLVRSTDRTEIQYVLPRDRIRAIDDPVFSEGEWLRNSDLVIGVDFNDEPRAYSIALLSSHEIVNDEAGNIHFAVTWCPLCFTGIVFDREVTDEVLTFGVSGKLRMNNLVMFDRETGTLWSQAEARALQGDLVGEELTVLSSRMLTWGEWKAVHPDSLALDPPDAETFVGADPYSGYYNDDNTLFPEAQEDTRLEPKQLVLGVVHGGEARAYPITGADLVINDELGGTKVVVALIGQAGGAIYFADMDREFTFTNGTVMTDDLGGRYSMVTGDSLDAVAGLEELSSTVSFWFAWKDHYPDTTVWGISGGGSPAGFNLLSQGVCLNILVIFGLIYGGFELNRQRYLRKPWGEKNWGGGRGIGHGLLFMLAPISLFSLASYTIDPVVRGLLVGLGWTIVALASLVIVEGLLLWRRGLLARNTRLSRSEIGDRLERIGWRVDKVTTLDPLLAATISSRTSDLVGGIGRFGQVLVEPQVLRQIELAVEGIAVVGEEE